ncbi:protein, SNF2 family, partial [Oesophagostomum dentatum]
MSDSRSFREYRNKSAVMEYKLQLSDDDSVSSLVDDSDPFEEPPDDRSSAKHVSNSSVHTSSIKASFVSEASASSDEEVSASPNGKGDSDSEQEILVSPTPTASTDSDLEMMSSQRTQLPFASTPRTVAKEFDLANRPRDRIHRVEVEDEEVIESIGASPNARDETSSRGEDEVVEESVVGQTGDDDIIVLDSTSDEDDGKDTKTKDASVHDQQSTAKTPSITSTVECEIITLSSDDEQESKKCVENSRPPTLSPVQFIREVQVVEPSSKYKDHSTSSLEEKRSNAQKLLLKRLNLPDGGARLEKQILELGDELERRRTASAERPDHVDTEIHDITNAVQQLQVNPEQINRRQLNINDVLRDEYRPVARAIQEKAIQELHNALMSQPDQTQFAETPEGLTCPLKEHQKSGLTWLLWRESLAPRGGILGRRVSFISTADEMGLGKTLSMISLIVHAKAERKRRRKEGEDQEDKERRQRIKASGMIASNATLIVAPAALIYHWEAEIKQRCDEGLLKTVIYHQNRKNLGLESPVVAVEVLTRSACADARKSSMLERIHWARIVLDEAHQIKNRKTKSSKAVCRLEADARWCVTGTPLHNNLWDLYSLIRFLRVDNFSEERYWKDYVTTSSKKSAERLNLLMKTFVLRREKSFISTMSNKPLVELPPKKSEEHFIEFEASERKAYDIMFQASRLHVQQLLTEEEQEGRPFRRWTKQKPSEAVPPARNPFLGAAASGANSNFQKMGCMLVLLLRLRQACLHFSLTKN